MTKFACAAKILLTVILLGVSPSLVWADSNWDDVETVVAIGDVHGDYDQFVSLLKEAGLVDNRLRWSGWRTHLVQVGDVPDRGPDTRKIIDLIMKLERGAKKAGGRVHALIGNHESMNMQGDLRYVHPGEFEAFVDRGSRRKQDRYYELTVAQIKKSQPEETWPIFDESWRQSWEKRFPLGYVEHQLAWSPSGKYGKWVLGHNAVVRINDTLFVHGGLSPSLEQASLNAINEQVRSELKSSPKGRDDDALINTPDGPLWYRGWAARDESAEHGAMLEAMLDRFGGKRIVIAHTPRMPAVLPRFDGRVLVVDVGLSAHYGSAHALLVINDDEIYAMQRGQRLDIPRNPEQTLQYLLQAAALEKDPAAIHKYLRSLKAPKPTEAAKTQTPTEEVGH